MPILNLLPQTVVIVNPTYPHDPVSRLLPFGTVAKTMYEAGESLPHLDGIPVQACGDLNSVIGLPDHKSPHPILVSALVAEAMNRLGLLHRAGVYTLQAIVWNRNNEIATTGLIYHSYLS